MNLQDVDTGGMLESFKGSVDDPISIIVVLGVTSVLCLLLLLKFSFNVMKRVDASKQNDIGQEK